MLTTTKVLYLYFWSILQNAAKVCLKLYLQQIQNQLEAKGTLVVFANATCCHKLPLVLFGE